MHFGNRLFEKTWYFCRLDSKRQVQADHSTRVSCGIIGNSYEWTMVHNKQGITIPGRKLSIIDVSANTDKSLDDQMFEVKPNF